MEGMFYEEWFAYLVCIRLVCAGNYFGRDQTDLGAAALYQLHARTISALRLKYRQYHGHFTIFVP